MKKTGFALSACFTTLFCIATVVASTAQTFTTLVKFDQTHGQDPFMSSLVQGPDGNFYGVTESGGTSDWGIVYKVTPAGKPTVLYNFCSQTNCVDGAVPQGSLVLGSNGNFYGTTLGGGTTYPKCGGFGCGTIFEITPGGKLTTLYSFCTQANCPDGGEPSLGLVRGFDGNFYGTTFYGGANSTEHGIAGTIFKITPAGTLTTLYSFCAQSNCPDGAGSTAALALASNGNFYGTTLQGGANADGTVFQVSPSGNLITLSSFQGPFGGIYPNGLVQATDGGFYGTTLNGGPFNQCNGGCGTVFRVSAAGKYNNVYSFCGLANCADGYGPQGPLIQASDGNLYGMTVAGGNGLGNGLGGTIFQISHSGLTTIHTFCLQTQCTDGSQSTGGLLQATNGTFYGTTVSGGNRTLCSEGCGTVFSLSMGLGPFIVANPNFAANGRTVGILGNNLTGTTSVSFNGTPATFTVVADTFIRATVPIGATTGTIQVTTPSGTLNSNVVFQVLP